MSPPSDGARPVRWIVNNAVFYDEPSAISYAATLVASATCNPTVFPVYTAADYDALRAEVERLRFTNNLIEKDNAGNRSRAEAAEAQLRDLIDKHRCALLLLKCDDEFIDKQLSGARAALNEGDGE